MGSFHFTTFQDKLSLTQELPVNYQKCVHPMDIISTSHEPNPLRRSRCEGDSLAYDAFWASRHPWDLIDYYLYLILIEKGVHRRETRLFRSWVIESDGSRWENFEYLLDSDDHDSQTGWIDPVIIFSSLPVPHAVGYDDRRIVLGMNLRTQSLVGYLFESAPEDLISVVSTPVWRDREVIIDLPLQRFVDILEHSIKLGQEPTHALRGGLFNFFRESTRRFHAGMDLVLTIQYIQFLRDAFFAGQIRTTSEYNVAAEFPSYLADREEYLRDLLCRESNRAWMSAHTGVTVHDVRQRSLANTPFSPDLFVDQLCPTAILTDEKATSIIVSKSSTTLQTEVHITTTCGLAKLLLFRVPLDDQERQSRSIKRVDRSRRVG
ncbi:hypothetical protein PDE_06788 [Penicillium oxalicum 114-2]|uniref:Uncharacterized protein n=1 Tax=Penicillium oxalicum (strain 114-2 / CGMCC 5302) TaxID=933388 RepID=S7ZMH6_PENO1|nr:hypothetical protein PDE_06788 [Penicillium oxalicum 114-2]